MRPFNLKNDPLGDHVGEQMPIINDFAINVATTNGSGSITANNILVKTIFRMGIPTNGKNMFPSNIKGSPTWYNIRVSKDGYIARPAVSEIAVVMNQVSAAEDISQIPPGGVCILPAEWHWQHSREDIITYEIPVKDTLKAFDIPAANRDQVANMVYVGAVAHLFNLSLETLREVIWDTFKGKEKPAQMNFAVVEAVYQWAAENLEKRDLYRCEPLDLTEGKIIISGNEAAALGTLFGGVSVVAWYPITPSTSLIDGIFNHQGIRNDPETGENTVAIIQAEDELAAIGMIVGAGWAGARSMTATSGPGISLMAEFAGLAYFAEIPCVIWDVTRVGPSTGMPTRTSQGDILFTYFLGHGDTRQVILLPGSVEECFEFGWRAFDLTEQLQTPIFVLSDLDLGMNNWLADAFTYPDEPMNRGKTLDKEALEAFIAEHGAWYRWVDHEQDGVGYRTIPGTDHPDAAYFTRGTGHNEKAVYSERSDDWLANMARLERKFETARRIVPQPITDYDTNKTIGIISYGSNDPAVIEARDRLAAAGIETNYLRIRALPLAEEIKTFVHNHERVYLIENNSDAQMTQLLRTEMPEDIRHVIALALGDALPMTATWIEEQITQQEGK